MSPTVLVAGALANKAGNGGAAWTRLSWALGLATVGCRVVFVEQLAPGVGDDAITFFRDVTAEHGLDATLLRADGTSAVGRPADELRAAAADAAMLLNISGHLTDPALTMLPATRVFVDLDPGWTQLWHADGTARLAPHDHWYTVGTAVGTPRSTIPADLPWRPVRQPVVLDHWPEQEPIPIDGFTTVAAWRGYGTMTVDGEVLGPKAHEFRRFLELPPRVPQVRFELALAIDDGDEADRHALVEHGWTLVDPRRRAGSPQAFREYVQSSPAELSVAQGMYVRTGSGWFADRTVRYLASGRPVVVQDTGWSADLPTDEGVLAFTTPDDAVAAIAEVRREPERHAKAARAIAEQHFAADVVLGRLCEEVGLG
jgi:hypothetical protein